MKKKITIAVLVAAMLLTVFAPMTVLAKWEQQTNGSWKYFDDEGGFYDTDGIYKIDGASYYFDSDGIMKTGWIKKTYTYYDDTIVIWYYANSSGVLQSGWQKIGNKWYYFDPVYFDMFTGMNSIGGKHYYFDKNGAMQVGWIKETYTYDGETYTDWFYAKSSGELASGWEKIGNTWYYFDPSGNWMYCDDIYTIDGKDYYFYPSGALGIGWIKETFTYSDGYTSTNWYYADGNGVLQSGWQKIGSSWYYFNTSSYSKYVMYCNSYYEIDGKNYFFNPDGTMAIGWGRSYFEYSDGSSYENWYYADASGVLVSGWKEIGGSWYYFSPYSYFMYTGVKEIDGKQYIFDTNGRWTKKTGWLEIKNGSNTNWYYIETDGTPAKGWKQIGGVWYYFEIYNGIMMQNGVRQIDGIFYAFAKNGAWITGTGWQKFSYTGGYVNWIYTENGKIVTGWKMIGGNWYYFYPPVGYMATGYSVIEGKMSQFNSSGVWTGYVKKIGWVHANGDWYYVVSTDGTVATGWKEINGATYYFSTYNGYMYYGGVNYIDDDPYFFAESGALQKGWIYSDWGYIYYADENGLLQTGWQTIDSKKYYFDPYDFNMYRNGTFWIESVQYYFNEDGVCAAG